MKHIVERAFELASSGLCVSKKDIFDRLVEEGYTKADASAHLAGVSIQRQLKGLMIAAIPSD